MKNLSKHTVFYTLIFFCISCGENKKQIPEDIIPQDKMIELITEIELTQALIKLKFSVLDSNSKDTVNQQELFNQVYEEFKISEKEFNTSLDYYSQEPELLEEMYVKVINSLSEKQVKPNEN